MNKKILILGASELQLPAILCAKKLGIETIAVDYDPNATGIEYADKFYNVSTLDSEGVLNVAKFEKIDGIMTICTDRPMNVIASVGTQLGLNTISKETAYVATNKAAMRKRLQEKNIPIPKFEIVKSKQDLNIKSKLFSIPFIIKPSDNSGSRGITLVNSMNQIKGAYEYAYENSNDGIVLLEEYMHGDEVSVEIFVSNKNPVVIRITDKITTGPPHFVEMGHTQPSRLSIHLQNQIKEIAKKSVEALDINLGPAHVEVKITENGPKIVELGARLGGDYITTDLVELSTGFDMVKATVMCALGIDEEIKCNFERASAIRYFEFNDHVNLNKEVISNIERMYINKLNVNEVISSRDREAFFILSADDLDELNKKIRIVENHIL